MSEPAATRTAVSSDGTFLKLTAVELACERGYEECLLAMIDAPGLRRASAESAMRLARVRSQAQCALLLQMTLEAWGRGASESADEGTGDEALPRDLAARLRGEWSEGMKAAEQAMGMYNMTEPVEKFVVGSHRSNR